MQADPRHSPPALFSELYAELHAIASRVLAGSAQVTLQPTLLIHEAFLKLAAADPSRINDRQHFLALAARVMRQVMVDFARRRIASERACRTLVEMGSGDQSELGEKDVLVIDEALTRLREVDERACTIAEFRVFAGMTLEEAASAAGVSRSTAAEDWRFARAWLVSALG